LAGEVGKGTGSIFIRERKAYPDRHRGRDGHGTIFCLAGTGTPDDDTTAEKPVRRGSGECWETSCKKLRLNTLVVSRGGVFPFAI
jgi:hypothetical protein